MNLTDKWKWKSTDSICLPIQDKKIEYRCRFSESEALLKPENLEGRKQDKKILVFEECVFALNE